MKVTLDKDELEIVNSLIENTLIRRKLMKYAKGHGLDIGEQTFDFNKETGEITCPSELLEIDFHV